ncbi:MAG TPA: hypothetical protein VKG92_00235 [Flavobacteriales bacterium]|nr:hypothetical protein [Flavobacteriales bacterium]
MENIIDSDWGRDEAGVWYTITLARTDCLDVWRSDRIYLPLPISWSTSTSPPLTTAQCDAIRDLVQHKVKVHVRMLAHALQGI